jgi:hypothetical protein
MTASVDVPYILYESYAKNKDRKRTLWIKQEGMNSEKNQSLTAFICTREKERA